MNHEQKLEILDSAYVVGANLNGRRVYDLVDGLSDSETNIKLGKVNWANNAAAEENKIAITQSYVVETTVPENDFDDHYFITGVLIAGGGNPYAKVYAGHRAFACANLMINAEHVMQCEPNILEISRCLNEANQAVKDSLHERMQFTATLKGMGVDPARFKGVMMQNMNAGLLKYIPVIERIDRDTGSIYVDWENTAWKYFNLLTQAINNSGSIYETRDTVWAVNMFNEIIDPYDARTED